MSTIKVQTGSSSGTAKISSTKMVSKKKGGLANQNLLHALLPGAKLDKKNGGKISVKMGISNDIVMFNVGGTKFETYRSTLYSQPNSPLADDTFLKRHFNEERKEYFFDRDPDVFKVNGLDVHKVLLRDKIYSELRNMYFLILNNILLCIKISTFIKGLDNRQVYIYVLSTKNDFEKKKIYNCLLIN